LSFKGSKLIDGASKIALIFLHFSARSIFKMLSGKMGTSKVSRGCFALLKRSDDQTNFRTLELRRKSTSGKNQRTREKGLGRPVIPNSAAVLTPPKAEQAIIPD